MLCVPQVSRSGQGPTALGPSTSHVPGCPGCERCSCPRHASLCLLRGEVRRAGEATPSPGFDPPSTPVAREGLRHPKRAFAACTERQGQQLSRPVPSHQAWLPAGLPRVSGALAPERPPGCTRRGAGTGQTQAWCGCGTSVTPTPQVTPRKDPRSATTRPPRGTTRRGSNPCPGPHVGRHWGEGTPGWRLVDLTLYLLNTLIF